MSKLWEIKQSATPKTVEIYIYSDIKGDGYDWWNDTVIKSETSANAFREQLAQVGEFDNINIYINSLGGSCMEGHAIYNQLKRCKAFKTVYVDGFACSVASIIAMAGDKIVMPKNTVMMIHNAWTYACGNATELRKCADDLDVMNSAFCNAYLNKTGDKLLKDNLLQMLEKETCLTAEMCIEYGLADELAEYDVNIESAKQALQQAKEQGIKQYADRLDKIVALTSTPPTPPAHEQPQGDETQMKTTMNTLEMCLNSFCSQLQTK